MIEAIALDTWADYIDRELNKFSGLTGNLAHTLKESISACVNALNRSFAEDTVGRKLSLSLGDDLSVCFRDPRFGERTLRIIIDASVNKLYYAIFNVALAELAGATFAPSTVALEIAAQGANHHLFNEDGTEFSYRVFSGGWSTIDQLATYLLQELIVPVFVDRTFLNLT